MRFRQVAPGLWTASRAGINVHALVDGGATILIDTGRPQDAAPILAALTALPPVSQIVLTHGHFDHAGGAARLSQATGAPVWIGAAEVDDLRAGRWRRPCRPSPTLHGPVLTRLLAARYPDRIAPVPAARALDPDSAALPFSTGLAVALVPAPGHSPGQVVLYVGLADGRRAGILADVAMNLAGLREPILYEDRPSGLITLRRIAREPCDLALFGHGPALNHPGPALAALARRAV